jgi:hypothetical protein
MRELTVREQAFIEAIAKLLADDDRRRLLMDLSLARANSETPDGSRIVFALAGYDRPTYRGQHPYPAEGKMRDRDGADITVMLHADESGRLLELEFIRWADGELIAPDWSTLQVMGGDQTHR